MMNSAKKSIYIFLLSEICQNCDAYDQFFDTVTLSLPFSHHDLPPPLRFCVEHRERVAVEKLADFSTLLI